ncbi:hypothetical protein [Oleiagrimonas sp.]|jgi:hypothetical protein|uniref:hypothetical protein n=1 Tax=Oleiagrimonas sp. TaxID=2010330 RepID=UPI002606BF4B|nr:hypothetical protein [Oleiagrimonas sp.]MDA3913053.1 hypothetical protein [Oleiagrimonas sp.]
MNILFYIVFLAQVLLISAIVPYLVRRRLLRVLDDFPALTDPQLHPRPLSAYRTGLVLFAWFNRLLSLMGLVLLVIVYRVHATDSPIPESWPAFFGGVQFLPMLLMDLFCLSLFRRLRELRPEKRRSASLQPRRLFDFMPRWLLALAMVMLALAVLGDLYLHDFDLGHGTLARNLTVLVTNGLLALLGWWKLRGRSLTPQPNPEARNRSIGAQLTVLAVISIAFSTYMLLHAMNAVLGLQNFDAIVMSLYFQTAMAVSISITLRTAIPLRQACA